MSFDHYDFAPPPPAAFGQRQLIESYLDAILDLRRKNLPGKDDRRAHFEGLQRLFEVDLPVERPGMESRNMLRYMLFRTADSFHSITTPWSGILEGGLIIRQFDSAGITESAMSISREISRLAQDSEREHHNLIAVLLRGLYGENLDRTFTLDELRAADIPIPVPIRYLPD
ncbi:hypothetical protein FNL39_111157 [Nocardia caishijiensis]|uniref:Uncharacterized protein n=1 Tax=Nocardia caishijiensis TaxID=184756 RepID=A0ABQ6YG35_9NOCA|nr:hypothetical protein FNL39_111157 [Nocardia caishijiensis]